MADRPTLEMVTESAYGYQQTLDAPRREVRLPLRSRHWRTEFQKSRDFGLVTAQKRTSETSSLDVSF